MLKDEQKSAWKTFLRLQYEITLLPTGFDKSDTLIGWSFLNNVRPWPYLEMNCCPAKARLIVIAKHKREYQDGLTRLTEIFY